MSPQLIAVFGSGGAPPTALDRPRRGGRPRAQAPVGHSNAGYGGVQGAAAPRARAAGGWTVGVTCRAFTFRSGANPYIQEVVEAARGARVLPTT